MSGEPPLYALALDLSMRRSWAHMASMVVGGSSAVMGIASVAARVLHQDEDLAMSRPWAMGLFVVGAAVFAWGGARGRAQVYPKWLGLTIGAGGLFIVAAALAAAPALLSSLYGRRRRDGVNEPNAASAMLEETEVEQLTACSTGPPRTNTWARTAMACWDKPGRDKHESELLLLAKVQFSPWLAGRVRNAVLPATARRVHGVGDGCAVSRREYNGREHLTAQASIGDWVVTLHLRPPKGHDADQAQTHLTDKLSACLERLSHLALI